MSYAGALVVHDADSHVLETPEMLHEFADPEIRDRIDPNFSFTLSADIAALRSFPPIAAIMPTRLIAAATKRNL